MYLRAVIIFTIGGPAWRGHPVLFIGLDIRLGARLKLKSRGSPALIGLDALWNDKAALEDGETAAAAGVIQKAMAHSDTQTTQRKSTKDGASTACMVRRASRTALL